MSHQPDPVSQNIIDWCQQDGIRCVPQQDTPNLEWGIGVGGAVTVYKQTRWIDRIYLQSTINLSDIHRTLVNQTWDNNQRNTMMFNLKKVMANLDVLLNFVMTNEELTGFHTYKIHCHETISKADFLEKYLRLQAVHEILINQLNIELGVALASSRNVNPDNTGR